MVSNTECISDSLPKKTFGQPTHYTHPQLMKKDEVTPLITQTEYKTRREKFVQKLVKHIKKNNSVDCRHIVKPHNNIICELEQYFPGGNSGSNKTIHDRQNPICLQTKFRIPLLDWLPGTRLLSNNIIGTKSHFCQLHIIYKRQRFTCRTMGWTQNIS